MSLPAPTRRSPYRHRVRSHIRHKVKNPRIPVPVRQYHRGKGLPVQPQSVQSKGIPSYLSNGLDSYSVVFDDGESLKVEATTLVSALDSGFNSRKKSGEIHKVMVTKI